MANLYYDNSADLSLIQAKKVGHHGYGSPGPCAFSELRDSGVSVRVGLPEGSASRAKAKKKASPFNTARRSRGWADVIMDSCTGHQAAKLYRDAIAPNLKPGKTLMFAHGFQYRFGTINPPRQRRRIP